MVVGVISHQELPSFHLRFQIVILCLQGSGPNLNFEEARKVCQARVVNPKDFACVQLVYGRAGQQTHILQGADMNSLTIYFLSCSCFFNYLPSIPSPLPPTSGDGKTHYIQQQLACSPASLTIAVNEAFTPLNAISKLRTLPLNQKNCAIFFNFTMLPPGVSGKKERVGYAVVPTDSTVVACRFRQSW